jgi:hypothetical protein
MFAFYVIFAVLVLVLYMLTQARDKAAVEAFADLDMPNIDMSAMTKVADAIAEAQTVSLEGMPTPPELFKKARELMAKYDQPDLWIHAARVMDKDPGQLARMNLGLE